MPILQQGELLPGQSSAPKVYGGVKQDNLILFQEKLMKLFKPFEYVTVKNILDTPIYWQYMPPENETELFSEDGYQKMIQRTEPEFWGLLPGESDNLVGGCAYRMLDILYKGWAASKTLKRFNDPTSPQFDEEGRHKPKNFNFSDGGVQDEVVELALIGKIVPTFQGVAMQPQPAMPGANLDGSRAIQQGMGNHYDPNAPLRPLNAAPGQQQNFVPQQPQMAPAQPQMQPQGQPPVPFPQNGPAPAPTHVQPVETAPEVDPNAPMPKTTEGAPLEEPVYAEPDSGAIEGETVEAPKAKKSSILSAAKKTAGVSEGK